MAKKVKRREERRPRPRPGSQPEDRDPVRERELARVNPYWRAIAETPEFDPDEELYGEYGYGGPYSYSDEEVPFQPEGTTRRGSSWSAAERGPIESEWMLEYPELTPSDISRRPERARRLRRRGPHRGVGPKGYRRSDERILDEVNERLTEHPFLDPSDVEVSVEGGEVTLEGQVAKRWMKHAIEDVVDDVLGVDDIHNRIRVRRRGPAAGSEAR